MQKSLVLIGSSSDVANQIYLRYKDEYIIHKVSSQSSEQNTLKVNDYMGEYKKIISFINNIENPVIIFFNGYLNENRPKQFPNKNDIDATIQINFLIPLFLTNEILKLNKKVKMIYISSVAASKYRYKNYIYGLSKRNLERSINQLSDNFLVIRFGQIYTKMSKNHSAPMFTISADKAADIVIKKINKKGLAYSTFSIFVISKFLEKLPRNVINYLEKKLVND